MKKFLALVLALVMTMSLVTVGASAKTDFTDDAKITNEEAVEVLNAMGVLTGYADGSFRPQATLTRGAGAKIIAYLMLGQAKADKLAATYTVFEDVTDTVGLAAYIEWAAATGIVDGYGDGNFGPYNQLTEYAFGKMLLTALGYVSAEEGYTGAGWQKNVYGDATAAGIYDGSETWGACDRETAARMALGALLADVVVYGKLSNLWVDVDKLSAPVNGINAEFVKKLLATVGVLTKEGAVETGVALWENYAGLKYVEFDTDIFDRPGHTWTYKASFDKFYMDAPVAEYTTKTNTCDILVDLGVAKTSKTNLEIAYASHNGDEISASLLGHNVCGDSFTSGQGVLTQVFELADGSYAITTIDTYLAKVVNVRESKHGTYDDETLLEVYTAQDSATDVIIEGVALTKGDYILINWSYANDSLFREELNHIAAGDYNAYYAQEPMGYINVLGVAETFEGALSKVSKPESMTLTVGGKDYAAANEYNLSACELTLGKTEYLWFVDQYGNIIGDKALPAAALKYGRVDAMKWVNDGDVTADEYVSANLVAADATASVVKLGKWDTLKALGADDFAHIGFHDSYYAVGEVKADNAFYYSYDNYYGVVKYDADYNVTSITNRLYQDGSDTDLAFSAKKVLLGQGKGGKNIYADDETQFLVYFGSEIGYKAYTGINALPTMSVVEGAIFDAKTSTTDVRAYADFVYIHAPNAILAGATTCTYVLEAKPFQVEGTTGNETYSYNVWVNGKETVITSAEGDLFGNATGMFDVKFNAAGEALSAVECTHYVERTANYVGVNAINQMNVTGATAYLVGATEITAYDVADIAVGDELLVHFSDADAKIVDVIYVTYKAVDNTMDGQKPLF